MDKKRLASRFMIAGGCIEILCGIIHFIWPFQFKEAGGFTDLSSVHGRTAFICVIAVGLCLTVFGVLSIYFSKKLLTGEKGAWVYGISQGILWEIRTIFEILLPVKLPMFFISNPTIYVLPLAFLLGLLYLVPLLIFKKSIVKTHV